MQRVVDTSDVVGSEPLPAGLGFCPAFNVPGKSGVDLKVLSR